MYGDHARFNSYITKHMYHYTKSLDKVGRTNKTTFNLPHDASAIQSTLENLVKVTSDLHYIQLLGIVVRLEGKMVLWSVDRTLSIAARLSQAWCLTRVDDV